jgi:methionyl-tRNA formyltransferase
MLKKEDGALDFNQPAEALARRVRAFTPWPGAFTTWEGRPFKVLRAHAVSALHTLPGQRAVVDGLPTLGTSDGLLVLEVVQPGGKKAMPGKAFLQGAHNWKE